MTSMAKSGQSRWQRPVRSQCPTSMIASSFRTSACLGQASTQMRHRLHQSGFHLILVYSTSLAVAVAIVFPSVQRGPAREVLWVNTSPLSSISYFESLHPVLKVWHGAKLNSCLKNSNCSRDLSEFPGVAHLAARSVASYCASEHF